MAVLQLHTLVLPILVYLLARQKTKVLEDTKPADQYDYIIVGGGAAGSLLANRLSRNSSVRVLLVEAGPKDNVTTEVPALALMLPRGPFDWNFQSTPQKTTCQSFENKQCRFASGKVIGGSSSIGYMIEFRGPKSGYDQWKEAGNEGWSYHDLLPYFKKHEDDNSTGENCVESELHSCDGEISFTTAKNLPKVSNAFIQYLENNSYSKIDLLADGVKDLSYNKGLYNIRDGIRMSSPNVFLKPFTYPSNLDIALNSYVTKILIDPETKRATGVQIKRQDEDALIEVKATKEVILSAGAVNSPKILMLSGIGPKEHLQKFQIPVILDVPGVGKNFQDPSVTTFQALKADRPLSSEELNLLQRNSISQWAKGTGPMTQTSLDVYAFLKTATSQDERPDVLVAFQSLPLLSTASYFVQRFFTMTDEQWEKTMLPLEDKPVAFVNFNYILPKSKGHVQLASADPLAPPEVDPNYFSEEGELDAIAEVIQTVMKNISDFQVFKDLGYKLYPFVFTPCNQHPAFSRDFYKCWLRHFGLSLGENCCTNRMGPDTDPTAVVDNRLRVKGIGNLRVVDASVIPSLPGGSMLQSVYVVAEKAAEMIIQDNL